MTMQARDWQLQDELYKLDVLFFDDWREENNEQVKDLKLQALQKVRQWREAAQSAYFNK